MSRLLALRATSRRLLSPSRQTTLAPFQTLPPATHTHAYAYAYATFNPGPSPPKLPAEDQAEFERLQRAAEVSSAFQPPSPTTNATASSLDGATAGEVVEQQEEEDTRGGLYRGAKPEFKGDRNPRTGEVGGPKNEPLRWGGNGDWSYNGKVTDF